MANAYCLWLRSNFPMRSNLRYFSILPRRTDVNSFCHRTTLPLPFSFQLFGSNDIYAALIGRPPSRVSSTANIERDDRSRKSVVRDEIPPKWITCSRLLRPDLARGFDMEDIWWCIFSACGLSIGLDRFARRFKIIFYSRGDV